MKKLFGLHNVRPESEKEGKLVSNDFENLVRINKGQADPTIEVLKNAFKETDFIKHYLPNDANREKAARFFLSIGVHTGIKYGEVYATSLNFEGAAIWMSSDSLPIHNLENAQFRFFNGRAGFC